ncbi:MAG: hypothetical protein H6553_12785 [Chitinophagales bacterium]|nr:hypothetical protein [Chitinophagales bacterium]
MVDQSKNNKVVLVFILTISVFIIWILSVVVIFFIGKDWTERGTIGDAFGSVNALFSGLTFVGLFYTILLQREEIKINRKEIEQNRKQLLSANKTQVELQQILLEQSNQTKLTAKLNAMSTVINYYNNQINNDKYSVEIQENARVKRRALIKQIDSMIEGLQNSDTD